ncbi:HAMP domain-containing protein [Christensenellaceae bacterium OttesenSCG-928-M15]|nr:HAMP domain-containing protein [Christensenellaceae bacterium OttesenSCG-928-M15]
MSRDTYVEIKLKELVPEAEAMGYVYSEYKADAIDMQTFQRMTGKLLEGADSAGIVLDAHGQVVFSTIQPEFLRDQAYMENIYQIAREVYLSGNMTANRNVLLEDGSEALSVCVPVENDAHERIGAIYLIKNPMEIKSATNKLYGSFMLPVAIVIPLMLLFSSFGVKRMTEPLHKMSDVAIKMSKGDFEVRADETEVGEVGVLARALNNLCDTLSQTIHELRAEKSQLRQILASFSEGVAATDSVGCLTIYNPALMQLFGAVRVGVRTDLIPDETIWNVFDEVYRTGVAQEMRYPMPPDRMIWITFAPVVSDEGERTGVVALFKDMTEMEKVEKSRRDYVQNISHELRTPLTAMRGLLEPLTDGMVTKEEDKQRYYKIMLREVLRLSRLITDMMQLTRLQAGTEYMEVKETDVNEILEDVCINYNKEAAQRGIKLVLDAPKLPHVVTDPDRIEQIIVILLSNAMRYTPEGGTITIKGENCKRVNVSVIDTGSGIAQEDVPYLFDRFYTADKSRTEGNTGLGLSIAKQLIDKLDEKIGVRSEVGKGSCFTFTLKKYVSNAIALGPAMDDWDATQSFDAGEITPLDEEDAVYEVIQEQHDIKAEKKKSYKSAGGKRVAAKKTGEKKKPEKNDTGNKFRV